MRAMDHCDEQALSANSRGEMTAIDLRRRLGRDVRRNPDALGCGGPAFAARPDRGPSGADRERARLDVP